jgi:hypothetical protein
MTGNKNINLVGTFVNNTAQTKVGNNQTINQRQNLSTLLSAIADAQGPK